MNKGKLRFIGNGSAFNTELGCNSGYILKGSSLVLFDCGGDVFSRLKHMNILTKETKSVTVFITHLHPDHVGSLGDLIYFCFFILNIKARVVTTEPSLKTLLGLMGVTKEVVVNEKTLDLYDLKIATFNNIHTINNEDLGDISYEPVEVKHYPTLRSAGYLVDVDNTTIYFSGDSCEMPVKVIHKLIDGEIDELYQDTCDHEFNGNPHFPINKLVEVIPKEFRNKVFCMHMDERMYANKHKIRQFGFNRILNDFEIKAIEYKTKTAVYAGSFDPITEGHRDMIAKSSKMFEKVVVGVLVNNKKKPVFSMEERVELIKRCVADLPNVEVKMFTGLLVDFAKENNAQVIIRGLRSVSDFENEIQIAMTNKQLNKDIETSLLVPDIQHQYISSSLVRELASMKADISWIVPAEILEEVKVKLGYYNEENTN